MSNFHFQYLQSKKKNSKWWSLWWHIYLRWPIFLKSIRKRHLRIERVAIHTAPVGKRRSSMQYPSAKHNNLQPTPRPITTSITSHPTLVVDRRATRLANLARIARALVTGPSGARHPSVTRRTAARPSQPQSMDSRRSHRHHRSSPYSRTPREARPSSWSRSGCGKSTTCADQHSQATIGQRLEGGLQ